MKQLINYICLLSAVLMLSTSCERDIEFETTSITPPSLAVVVHKKGAAAQRTEGAKVMIYKINPTDKSKTLAFTQTTDNKGYAKLTNAEMLTIFPEPTGNASRGGKLFFETASVDEKIYGEIESAYINMTDGETWQWIEQDTTMIRVSTMGLKDLPVSVYVYKTKEDRDNRVLGNAIVLMSKTELTPEKKFFEYLREAIVNDIYKKQAFISVEQMVDGRLAIERINVANTALRNEYLNVTLKLMGINVTVTKGNLPLASATVNIFNTEEDRDKNQNVVASLLTDDKGVVKFTKEGHSLIETRKYYISVTSGATIEGKANTKEGISWQTESVTLNID